MLEFSERVLELGNAKEPFVFGHLGKASPLASFGVQARGEEEWHILCCFGAVVFFVFVRCVEWGCANPRHVDELKFPPSLDPTGGRPLFTQQVH